MDDTKQDKEMVELDPKKLKQLLKVMRENGVTYLKTADIELHVAPEAPNDVMQIPKGSQKRVLSPQEQFQEPYFKW